MFFDLGPYLYPLAVDQLDSKNGANITSKVIYPLLEVLLTGNLTNHKAKSAIFFLTNKPDESRLTSVDLSLKNGVYWRISVVETGCLLMFIHVYLMLEIKKRGRDDWFICNLNWVATAIWGESLQRIIWNQIITIDHAKRVENKSFEWGKERFNSE